MAIGLAEAGADVVASSRRAEQVDQAAKAIEAKGRRALRLTSDVGDRATLQALLDGTVKEFGKVDILINCAGKIKREPTLTVSEERLGFRHYEYECDRNPAGLSDIRKTYAGSRIWADH